VGKIICQRLGLHAYEKVLAPVMSPSQDVLFAATPISGTPAASAGNTPTSAQGGPGATTTSSFGFKDSGKEGQKPTIDLYGSQDPYERRLGDWIGLADRVDKLEVTVNIAMVGKYTGLTDSYMSVIKGLKHASIESGFILNIVWLESTDLEPNMKSSDARKYEEAWRKLRSVDGVLVPGGFGNRGIEGMILAAKYCRESELPYFGICVGMQVAVIEACRSLLELEGANSSEFSEMTPHPCIVFMPEHSATVMGGTMRLGSRCTIIKSQNSLAARIYGGQPVIYERHRHRYEVNTAYVQGLENQGMLFSGQDERGQRMEIIEL